MQKPKDNVWHQLPAEEVAQTLGVNPATGLAAEEVRRRQTEHGPNRVTARPGPSAWLKFLKQFHQPLVYILLAAVGVTAFARAIAGWRYAGRTVAGLVGRRVVNRKLGFSQDEPFRQSVTLNRARKSGIPPDRQHPTVQTAIGSDSNLTRETEQLRGFPWQRGWLPTLAPGTQ